MRLVIGFILSIIVSFVIGLLLSDKILSSPIIQGKQVRQGGYSLINPLLECELGGERLSKSITAFRYKLTGEINKLKDEGKATDVSVYFRDLNNGVVFGIDERDEFSPASLLKLPIMLAYYKVAETNPKLLTEKIKYVDEDRNDTETFKPKNPLEKGKEYTVDLLLNRMITASDNNALAMLVEHMPLEQQDKIYKDLGISIPGVRGVNDYMTVTAYASFFRILYNASYLQKESSEKALQVLSKSDFDQGIRAGVPKGVTIANKFGERQFEGRQQLHDCGIVYYTDRPYLLCVMSRGADVQSLAGVIKDISSLVYQEVDTQARSGEKQP